MRLKKKGKHQISKIYLNTYKVFDNQSNYCKFLAKKQKTGIFTHKKTPQFNELRCFLIFSL